MIKILNDCLDKIGFIQKFHRVVTRETVMRDNYDALAALS